MDKLYIVIPAYNEEVNIQKTIQQWYPIIEKHNGGGASKMVVVNDGSTDVYKRQSVGDAVFDSHC